MQILFVHKDFPAQFRYLATALAAGSRHRVLAIGDARRHDPPLAINGVERVNYLIKGAASAADPLVQSFDAGVRRGRAVGRIALDMRSNGVRPDLIFVHPGWGEALFLKDVFPESRLVGYFEFFFHADGADLGFDPEYPPAPDERWRIRTLNAINLLGLEACDHGVCPTQWQLDLHPAAYRGKLTRIHDGIDCDRVCPRGDARLALPDGRVLAAGDEVLTFTARNLEPYRGFHVFMRALPALLARRPRLQVVIVGGDGVGYGPPLPAGDSHRARLVAEVGSRIDLSRVHFLGTVPYATFLDVLAVSAAHVYLTYPFVLSWSMLEAMAAECVVIASATPPVMEVIEHERNGLLVDFFDTDAIAGAVERALDARDGLRSLRRQARATVLERYDLKTVALPQYRALIDRLI